ncbi:hypothetical protein ACQ4PT_018896 [Festuca glaucescens]
MAFLVLLCLLLCSYCAVALGGFVVVPTSSFQPQPVCSTSRVTTEPSRASLPLAHRHGPCAPSGSGTSDKPSLAARSAGTAPAPRDAVDSLEYVVTLGIGTPAVQQTVLIDTGSDLSWVQCKPCNSPQCYPQKDPLFDPTNSSSFRPIPCGTAACKQLVVDGYDNGCTNSSTAGAPSLCGYAIEYGNGAITTGVYGTETLAINAGVSLSKFGFGCGSNQHGPYDRFDGLLGLGGAPESLVSQYGAAFSYCLPPTSSSAGFLTLAPPANNTAGFVFTPMYR